MRFAESERGRGVYAQQETAYGSLERCIFDLAEPGTTATAQVELRRADLAANAYAECENTVEAYFAQSLRVRNDSALWDPLFGSAPADCDITVVGEESRFFGSGDVLVMSADGEQQVLWFAGWLASETLVTPAMSQEVLVRTMVGVDALKDFSPFPDSG